MVSIESSRGGEDGGGLARGAPARSTSMEAAEARAGASDDSRGGDD